jgi:methylase of polypeptide subunit release factors
MDQSVYIHEPNLALYGWKDTWFELYEKLIDQIFLFKKHFSIENIIAFFEIWFDQYEYSQKYLSQKWLKFEYFQDMAKIHRCIKIEF